MQPTTQMTLPSADTQQTPHKQTTTTTKIPEECLRSIVMPLYAAECSNKTFRNILTIIENMSALPGARQIFLHQLNCATSTMIPRCVKDLEALLKILNSTKEEIAVQQLTLETFTPATSNQAKLLRIIKTIDYIYTTKKSALSMQLEKNRSSSVQSLLDFIANGGAGGNGRRSSDSPTPSEVRSDKLQYDVV